MKVSSSVSFKVWFVSGSPLASFFHVLCCMHCNPILAFLTSARLVEIDWDATGVERFPLKSERSKFIFILLTRGVMRKRSERTKATEGGHDEICPVYRGKFTDRGMFFDFAERARHRFFEKGDDYTESQYWTNRTECRIIVVVR